MRFQPVIPPAELTEKQFELQAIGTAAHPGLARQTGFRVYHTLRSKGSQPGYPDWTLVRERVVFLELKRQSGKPSDAQKEWLNALHNAGAEAYIVRPSDLDLLAIVLAARKRYGDFASGPDGEKARRASSELHRRTRDEINPAVAA